jgi:outer membrane protein
LPSVPLRIMKNWLLIGFFQIICFYGIAQDVWDLRRCVDYAIVNNIQVRQNKVQEDLAEVNLKQSSASRIPSVNFQGSTGGQFGRSIDPATNLFTTNAITFINTAVSSNVTLFNWFSQKNQVAANRLSAEAARAQTEVIQNDISLNVAAAYLQALLSHEQMRIAAVQVEQIKEQLSITRKRVEAGSLPELNAAELNAQLARDSATFVAAESQFEINQLNLKALLNLDAALPFRIAIPAAESIPVDPIASLQPDDVFEQAVNQQPRQQANQLRLEAAQKNSLASKALMYPTISAFANLQSAYSSAFETLPKGQNVTTIVPTQSFVTFGGNNYNVNTPISRPVDFVNANVPRQLNYNFRQIVGVGLNVPIFNGYQAKSQYQRARLNETTLQLQMLADTLQLKQDIYQAYQGAVNALNTFQSRQRAVETAQYSFDLGAKRYEVGLLPVIELITLQNNLLRSRIDEAASQYEYIFRLKVLEFYKYNTIKL